MLFLHCHIASGFVIKIFWNILMFVCNFCSGCSEISHWCLWCAVHILLFNVLGSQWASNLKTYLSILENFSWITSLTFSLFPLFSFWHSYLDVGIVDQLFSYIFTLYFSALLSRRVPQLFTLTLLWIYFLISIIVLFKTFFV